MNNTTESAYGLKVLCGNHASVRRLRKGVRPTEHGHKIWTSSWLLIDYLHSTGIDAGLRILDLGCGWGLAGIHGAKVLKADVVWADVDVAVLPYLKLMAHTNQVKANFLQRGIEQIDWQLLRRVDMIIASDLCFCDTMIDPLERLIKRAKAAGTVRQVLIADPGRWPFEDLCELMVNQKGVTLIERRVYKPHRIDGKILKIRL